MAYGGQQMFSNKESIQEKFWKCMQSNYGFEQQNANYANDTAPISNPWSNMPARNSAPLLPRTPATPQNFTRMLNESQTLLSRLALNNGPFNNNDSFSINWKTPHSSTVRNQHSLFANNKFEEMSFEERYFQLNRQIESFAMKHSQSEELLGRKQNLCSALLFVIWKLFPQASLHLFGSSWNGFGSDTSDVDFCVMTSPGRKVNQSQKEAERYLKDIKTLMNPIAALRGVQYIYARVPILKFSDAISGCHCDLSVNNDMAIRNTHLLRTYSKVDDRVRPLVMAIKRWASARRINDATQGTLSSYALVLMCLHYLQCGCKPPVLDSLQKVYPNYFRIDSDVNQLQMLEPWKTIPRNNSDNKESVGQLLVGFFQYFESFSWNTQVISVREGCTLIKKSYKGFEDKYMCVEDPLESYNTTRTVYDLSLFNLIKREFRRANWRLTERLSLEHIT